MEDYIKSLEKDANAAFDALQKVQNVLALLQAGECGDFHAMRQIEKAVKSYRTKTIGLPTRPSVRLFYREAV